jgi:pyridinium-3,5-biscarboxylic acid mononucleotide sulfurtransferase
MTADSASHVHGIPFDAGGADSAVGRQPLRNLRPLNPLIERLDRILYDHAPLLVAYSGGVDSSYLLAHAVEILGNQVLGVIADSPSLPRQALDEALHNAKAFGASVRVIQTREMHNPNYINNPINRCYFCKLELFERMTSLAQELGFKFLAYGENHDDAALFRPGSRAASELKVLAPLRQTGLTKADIRLLSAERGLNTAHKPAQPCLSSRILTGIPVTTDKLALIEKAEEIVRSQGFSVFRVRYTGTVAGKPQANLVVAPDELPILQQNPEPLLQQLRAAGFGNVSIDPEGYRQHPVARAGHVSTGSREAGPVSYQRDPLKRDSRLN